MEFFTKGEMISRRNAIFSKMENNSIMVLFAGTEKMCSADEVYDFVVNKNFYYLTQIDQKESILVLTKTETSCETFLFVLPFDEVKEKWTGRMFTQQEAREISYIENILLTDIFDTKLDQIINNMKNYSPVVNVYIDLEPELKIFPLTSTVDYKEALQNRYDEISVLNAYDLIVAQRMVKSDEEVNMIEKAIEVTKTGINSILNAIKPGMFEYELSSLFDYTIRSVHNCKNSFNTIAASGKNAVCLHYPTPNDTLKDNDLMLFDLGAHYNHYCADISRTFPINGKFNEIQARIYNEVLKCNKLVINCIVPGITIKELQQIAIKSLTKSLMDLNLIKSENEYLKYYYHNVSHHLGLDTHDASFRDKPLEPGNVITVEPGLYIKELGIGIRIEDDVLVTNEGSLNLSQSIVKEISDIEKLMKTRM